MPNPDDVLSLARYNAWQNREMTEALESKPTWQIRREYTPVGMTEDDASQSTVELAPPAPPPAVVAAAPRATAPSRPMAGVVLKLQPWHEPITPGPPQL